jgi:rod shape-determining protein MreC
MKDIFSRSLQTTIVFMVVGGILALALGGYFSSASNWFTGFAVDTQTWFSTRFLALEDFLSAPRDLVSLRQRNAELESEVARLQAQVIELQQRVGETETLAALVAYARKHPESSYKAASVIGRDPSPFLHYVIINSGSNDGVLRGMPVMTAQGLIGRVDAVISDAARVQLITDPASSINIRLQNSNLEAVLTGSVTGNLSLDLIPQNIAIEEGDVVLTSGLGGGFPPDLIIGQLVNVRRREADLFQEASVQPVVDFSRLQIVLIITNFRPVNIEPLVPVTP